MRLRLAALVAVVLVALVPWACASWVVPSDGSAPSDGGPIRGCSLPGGGVCAYGQACPAGDGCNSCTCSPGGMLACTTAFCPTGCTTTRDCPLGQECAGGQGCGTPWTCQHTLCAQVASTWCDCAGVTYTTPDACATRPYSHTGPCETPVADAGPTCAPLHAMCSTSEECCTGYCMPHGAPINTCETPPPGTFGCGNTTCSTATEYCELTYSDVPTPDSATCRPLGACASGAVTCSCVAQNPCGGCRIVDSHTVRFQCPGG
jgi:hypothetical protein